MEKVDNKIKDKIAKFILTGCNNKISRDVECLVSDNLWMTMVYEVFEDAILPFLNCLKKEFND